MSILYHTTLLIQSTSVLNLSMPECVTPLLYRATVCGDQICKHVQSHASHSSQRAARNNMPPDILLGHPTATAAAIPAAILFVVLERVLFPLDSRPHLLEMSEHSHVGIHEAVYAVLHAGLFVSVELSGADLAGDALSEARVGQGVNCCLW